jgi:hypothetical protein
MQGRDCEEIHGGDGFAVIVQKGRPSFCWFRVPRYLPHPSQHCSFRNFEAQHFQLAMDARRAPGWVLNDHAENEFAQFPADTLPARTISPSREPSPVELESRPVPANDGLRLDEDQRLLPTRPEPPQYQPEQLIREIKLWLGFPPIQHAELLPEREILQEQVMTRIGRLHE